MENYDFRGNNSFEFEIKDLEEITYKKSEHTGVPHRANFNQILIINSRNTVQEVDFRKIALHENQILFVAKNQVIRFDTQSDHTGKIILFTDIFFKRTDWDAALLKETNLFNPFSVNTIIDVTPKIQTFIDLLEQEASLKTYKFQGEMLHHLLSAFIIEASQNSDQNYHFINNEDHTIALEFADLVEKNFKVRSKVNDYLQLIGISAKRLTSALKRTTGKTPKQFLDDRMLLEAKRLLVYSNKSIKEIGFELGFDEPTNFSKFFRSQSQKSPVEFKSDHST